jgi:hypothetical protein
VVDLELCSLLQRLCVYSNDVVDDDVGVNIFCGVVLLLPSVAFI